MCFHYCDRYILPITCRAHAERLVLNVGELEKQKPAGRQALREPGLPRGQVRGADVLEQPLREELRAQRRAARLQAVLGGAPARDRAAHRDQAAAARHDQREGVRSRFRVRVRVKVRVRVRAEP